MCVLKKKKKQGKKERESEKERNKNENPGSSVLKEKKKEEKKAVLVWTVWKFVFVFLNWHLKQNIEGLYPTFHLHIVWDRQEAKLKKKKTF